MDAVNEAQCRVGAKKSRKQDEVKQNTIQANSIEWAAWIINRGISYDNLIFTVANLVSVTKTTEFSAESILQAIIPLSDDTLKGALIHMGGKIIDLPDLKKQIVVLEVVRRWVRISLKREQ